MRRGWAGEYMHVIIHDRLDALDALAAEGVVAMVMSLRRSPIAGVPWRLDEVRQWLATQPSC